MQKYTFESATNKLRDPELLTVWRQLLVSSSSPEKIYQSPEFFEYLFQTNDGHDQIELILIRRADENEIVGVVPIRFRSESFDFGVGARVFLAPKIPVIILLGSVPLFPLIPGLLDALVKHLFVQFPLCRAVSLPALPSNSEMHTCVKDSMDLQSQFGIHVLHGWRESHSIPIPVMFDQYLQQFSAKKRFNMKRQIRLLAGHVGGELRLDRIEKPEQIEGLVKARNSIIAPKTHPTLLSQKKLQGLAQLGLLHCYALMSGDRTLAVLMATRSDNVLHLHNIYYAEDLARFSVGASALFMAIEDLTANFNFESIDLGYSNPSYNHQSSNLVEERGHILLLRRKLSMRLLSLAHERHVQILNLVKNQTNRWMPRIKAAILRAKTIKVIKPRY